MAPRSHDGSRYLAAVRTGRRSDQPLIDAVRWGEGLGDLAHVQLVVEALHSARSDDDLWLIGDGPVEEGLLPRRAAPDHLRALRPTDPKVERLFDVMRRYHLDAGRDPGWWAED